MDDTQKASTTPRGLQAAFTIDFLERVGAEIVAKPVEPKPLTKAEALAFLAPKLSEARGDDGKGQSFASLVESLQANGLHFSERAVSRAISTYRASSKPAKPTRKNSTAGALSAV